MLARGPMRERQRRRPAEHTPAPSWHRAIPAGPFRAETRGPGEHQTAARAATLPGPQPTQPPSWADTITGRSAPPGRGEVTIAW